MTLSLPRRRRTAAATLTAVTGLVAGLALLAVPAQHANALAPTTMDSGLWGVNGRVYAIVQTPDVIYLAGKFTQAMSPNGATKVSRINFVALNASTGAPLPMIVSPNKDVHDLALSPDGQTLYLVGDFTKVGSSSRKKVAAINASTGALRSFNPGADLRVEAVATRGDLVYLGGKFQSVDGQFRDRLAAVSATTGDVDTTWTPTANEVVHDIKIDPLDRVLVGGLFTGVNGSPGIQQRRLAALNPVTGALLPWAKHPQFEVFDIHFSATQIFVAAGGAGGHAMAYKMATGVEQWVQFSDGNMQAVAYQNGVLYVGGHQAKWNGLPNKKIVALDPTSGNRLTWNVEPNSALGVWSLHTDGRRLAMGGDFTKISGKTFNHFARVTEPADSDPPTAPGRPSLVSATFNTITIEFSPADDDQAANLLYRVYKDGGSTPVGVVSSSASSGTVQYTDGGMLPGETHTYEVSADDGTNEGPRSPVSDPLTTNVSVIPQLVSLEAFDVNTNGRVDEVRATFSQAVTCTGACMSPWTLQGFPSGTTLDSVSVNDRVATLELDEGGGALTTVVGSARVRLTASGSGIVDAEGDPASFPLTKPADRMSPVPVNLSTDDVAGTEGVMEPGDTFTVTFSEPLDPSTVIAANAKQSDPNGPANDTLTIVGLTDGGIDTGTDAYVVPDEGTIVYLDSTLTLLSGNTVIRSTVVGDCTGTACGDNGPGAVGLVTFSPEPYVKDLDGNTAAGERSEDMLLY